MKTRILIIDDDQVFIRGIRAVTQSLETIEIIGDSNDVSRLDELVRSLNPDVVILETKLRRGSGLEALRYLSANFPSVKCLVVSTHDRNLDVDIAVDCGAKGFLSKFAKPDELIEALRKVTINRPYFSDDHMQRMAAKLVNPKNIGMFPRLGPRETEIFGLLGDGYSSVEIAQGLGISVKTVESYRESLRTKLDLRNGPELTQAAIRYVTNERKRSA